MNLDFFLSVAWISQSSLLLLISGLNRICGDFVEIVQMYCGSVLYKLMIALHFIFLSNKFLVYDHQAVQNAKIHNLYFRLCKGYVFILKLKLSKQNRC